VVVLFELWPHQVGTLRGPGFCTVCTSRCRYPGQLPHLRRAHAPAGAGGARKVSAKRPGAWGPRDTTGSFL
jgi:hypothetical protein